MVFVSINTATKTAVTQFFFPITRFVQKRATIKCGIHTGMFMG